MERFLDWILNEVIPFIGGAVIVVFAAEIAAIVILALWRLIQLLI